MSFQWWYWILLVISSIISVIAITFWLSLFGYNSTNGEHRGLKYINTHIHHVDYSASIISSEFTEDDGPLRMDSSACDSPSGSVRVRDALVVVCSVLSHLVLLMWLLSLGIMRCGVATNTGSTNV